MVRDQVPGYRPGAVQPLRRGDTEILLSMPGYRPGTVQPLRGGLTETLLSMVRDQCLGTVQGLVTE